MKYPHLAIGIDFGGTRIKLGLVDEEGRVQARGLYPTPRDESSDVILDRLVEAVNTLLAGAGLAIDELRGIGLGTPGPLDPDGEQVLFAPNIPGWEGFPLRSRLAERLGRPVVLENDANAAALGEYWVGAGREIKTLIYLGLGTGVGGGIILDGQLWRGAHGAGAEIGHITLDPTGELCGCGNRGCLETLAAAPAIEREAARAIEAGRAPQLAALVEAARGELTPKIVAQAASDGDAAAMRIYADVGTWLGAGVATVVNIFDPEMVVIGGGVAGSAALFMPNLEREARRRSFEVIYRRVSIVPAELGDDAGVVGAAALIML